VTTFSLYLSVLSHVGDYFAEFFTMLSLIVGMPDKTIF
jgi:hypothetical protein